MREPVRPLIVTLALDPRSTAIFARLRQDHFPPERNLIPAHVTLFHRLPGEELAAVDHALRAVCRDRTRFAVEATGLRRLGGGVAISLKSPDLDALRHTLAERWQPWLTPQDRQGFAPHVTIQNKVAPATARALYDTLAPGFRPFAAQATGFLLWRYLGGPWDAVAEFPFAGPGGRSLPSSGGG